MKKNYTQLREKSRFQKTIGITFEDYEWVEQNRGKKSRAAFLEEVIKDFKNPNLFKKGKSHEQRPI